MSDEKRTYTWSRYGERFEAEEHSSREAAAAAGFEECLGADIIWTGVIAPAARHTIDADDVIERLREEAHEEVGEVADEWLENVSAEEVAELAHDLNAALTAWLDRHKLQPTYFAVQDVEQHDREEE